VSPQLSWWKRSKLNLGRVSGINFKTGKQHFLSQVSLRHSFINFHTRFTSKEGCKGLQLQEDFEYLWFSAFSGRFVGSTPRQAKQGRDVN